MSIETSPSRELRRGLDRLREPCAQVGLHRQPVDHDLDRVLELLVERDLVLEQLLLAVDLHAREAFVPQLLEDVLVLALAVAHDGRVDGELRSLGELEDLVDDRLLALAGDRLAADRAVRPPDPRVEEAQVVVDLGDRADGRARVAARSSSGRSRSPGDSPSIESTSGFSIIWRNWRAYAERLST